MKGVKKVNQKKIDVFISHHTKTCLEVTEAICNKLESLKIRVWYAPRDTIDSYARSIVNAINQCNVFVLILNKASSFSEDVLNEINIAVERLRNGEKISILPFHITDEEISSDAKYYIGRMHWIDAITPPMQDRIHELASKICYLLDMPINQEEISKKESCLKSSAIFPNINFFGREEELNQIHEKIEQYGRVFVMGMGGIGKTEIVKQYIHIYQKEYHTVLFLKYNSSIKDMIINEKELSISNFSKNEEETEEEYFIRKLEKLKNVTDEKTLFVVDNFDTENDENLEELINGKYKIIFTTRNDFEYLGYPVIKVTPFEKKEEQMKLFEHHYKRPLKEEDKNDIYQIFELIGGHTLTIELIAKLMNSKRIKSYEMLSTLKNKGISSHIEGTINHGFLKANTIYGYIDLLFDTSKLSQEEIRILSNLWMFPSSGFDLETFASLIELEDCSLIDTLIKKSWISYDFYLDTIALHPVIREVIKEKYHPNFEQCSILIKNLSEQFQESWGKSLEEKIMYGEVAQKIYRNFPNIEYRYSYFYCSMIMIFNNAEKHDLAEEIVQKMFTIYQEKGIMETEQAAKLYYELGDLCLYRRDNKQASMHLKQAINIMEKIDPNSLYTAFLNRYLGFIYIKIEEYQEAELYLKKSRKIYEKIVEEESLEMGSQYVGEARICYYKKEYEKALELAKKSYQIFYQLKGEVNSSVLSSMQTISMIYSKMENYEEAIKVGKRMIEIDLKLYPKYAMAVLNRYEVLGNIYIEAKQKENALSCFSTIVEELEKHNDKKNSYYQKMKEKIKELSK